MSANIIYMFLGVILIINVLFFTLFMKSKKKAPSSNPVIISNHVEKIKETEVDENEKTQALGSNSISIPEQVKPSVPSEEKTEILGISNLSTSEKESLKNTNKNDQTSDETMVLGASTYTPPKEIKVTRKVVYSLNGQEEEYNWNEDDVLVIGREPQNTDLTITKDSFVGRTHALVYKKENKYFLVDLNSKNGTFVDDIALKGQKEISLEQTFKLGQTDFVIK